MQRIQLGAPYEEFIKKLIETGYYATTTEVIRDALRTKMSEMEVNRIESIRALVAEGQASVDRGETVAFDEDYVNKVMTRANKGIKDSKTIPSHVRP